MRVVEAPVEEDLAPFSRFLWQHRVPHRIFEERGRQVLELANDTAAEQVRAAYRAWRAGEIELDAQLTTTRVETPGARQRLRHLFERCPGVLILLLTALAVFPFSLELADGNLNPVAGALTFVDLHLPADRTLLQVLGDGQVWRWFTPVLLHFSVVHVLFNCAVTFELGRRVEMAQGTLAFLLLVVAIGVVSNCAQYLFDAHPLFGGLSGVAYGLLGYVLVMRRRRPAEPAWRMAPGLAFGLLLFLVIFSTGITEPFGLFVANAAHWAGVVTGALLALIVSLGNGRARA
jgi:GlpG protein